MKPRAIIIIRFWGDKGFYATVRLEHTEDSISSFVGFVYDTEACAKKSDALKEARAFCRWKKLRIVRIKDLTL